MAMNIAKKSPWDVWYNGRWLYAGPPHAPECDCEDCNLYWRWEPVAEDMNEQAPLEYTHCSRCRDNAEFAWDALEGWISICCGARPVPVDPPDGG
jgi:hypothetical protein